MLVFGPIGRRLVGAPVDGAPTSEGALRFALATVATGHAVIALALKLLEERTITERLASVGGGPARGAGARVDRWSKVGVSAPRGQGEVRACVSSTFDVVGWWRTGVLLVG